MDEATEGGVEEQKEDVPPLAVADVRVTTVGFDANPGPAPPDPHLRPVSERGPSLPSATTGLQHGGPVRGVHGGKAPGSRVLPLGRGHRFVDVTKPVKSSPMRSPGRPPRSPSKPSLASNSLNSLAVSEKGSPHSVLSHEDVLGTKEVLLNHGRREHDAACELFKYRRLSLTKALYLLRTDVRSTYYKNLLKYLLFLVLLFSVLWHQPVHNPFEQTAAVSDTLVGEVASITSTADWYQWLDSTLVPGVEGINSMGAIRSVGAIQLRSNRVRAGGCSTSSLFADTVCFPQWSPAANDLASFGNSSSPFVASSGLDILRGSLTWGRSVLTLAPRSYGREGFVVLLPDGADAAKETLRGVMAAGFVDDATRVLSTSFVLYQVPMQLFTVGQVVVELPPTGLLITSAEVRTFELLRYTSFWDFARNEWSTVAIACFVVHYARVGIHDIVHKPSMWTVVDCVFVATVATYIGLRMALVVKSSAFFDDCVDCQASVSPCFVDHSVDLAFFVSFIYDVSAVVALAAVLKMFAYLKLNTRMSLMWHTLGRASKDLLAFAVIMVLILFGFSAMGFLAFGRRVQSYHSLSDAWWSNVLLVGGEFETYWELREAAPFLSWLYMSMFIVLVFVVAVNTVIAILADSFDTVVKASRESSDKGVDVEYDLWHRLTTYFRGIPPVLALDPSSGGMFLPAGTMVLLADQAWLTAERQRLRRLFKAAVHVVRFVVADTFPHAHGAGPQPPRLNTPPVSPQQPRTGTAPLLGAHSPFLLASPLLAATPVATARIPARRPTVAATTPSRVCLPLSSSSTSTPRLLSDLRAGRVMQLRRPGLLYADCLTVEVLPCDNPPFSHDHADGKGKHVRRATVVVGGKVTGGEELLLPWQTVAAVAAVDNALAFKDWVLELAWRPFCCCKRKQTAAAPISNSLSDAEIENILTQHAESRGVSCRFDELLRDVRVFLAHRGPKRAKTEAEVTVLCASIFQRFSGALFAMDPTEEVSTAYRPKPINTANVELSPDLDLLCTRLATNSHELWAEARVRAGWKWGAQLDTEAKLHPSLRPWPLLPETARSSDQVAAAETIKVIISFGFRLTRSADWSAADAAWKAHHASPLATDPQLYVPRPYRDSSRVVSKPVARLGELLAENHHDLWARQKVESGWRYGVTRNDQRKEHPSLVPFFFLSNEERSLNRQSAMATLKLIVGLGFDIRSTDESRLAARRRDDVSSRFLLSPRAPTRKSMFK